VVFWPQGGKLESKSNNSVEVVIPVYNEERDLPRCIRVLHSFLKEHLTDRPWRILIADNGSTDATLQIAAQLSRGYPEVAFIHLPVKGRGRALKQAFLQGQAGILSYMDVDLATGLEAFPQLLQALDEGYDIAIGSRYLAGSRIRRTFSRRLYSWGYNFLFRALFGTRVQDAQCGFKAMKAEVARDVLPKVKDPGWSFDTELLLRAEKRGYRIKEIPVEWHEDPESKVRIPGTILRMLRVLLKLRWELWRGG